MRTALAIARKELSIYFTTPWAYGVFTAMTALSSFFFVNLLVKLQEVQADARANTWAQVAENLHAYRNLTDGVVVQLWGIISVITLFIAPFLSMRLFAEEKRNKTFELLLTAPVRPIELVLGKYLGGLGIISATLGITIIFPLVLSFHGRGAESGPALDWSTVLLGYAGVLLWGATCMAVGLFISALTESQMLAAFLSFSVLLPWMMLTGVAQATEEPVRSVLMHLSFDAQLDSLFKGVLEVKTLVFFTSVIVFSLLLTHRTVEARRWA
ncbi:ABC transporter permease [Myxococcus stipitatus]|uniref:ABC transporter permease n=1 Tax=Myxococcus stipitatus TaxID=83455 RepID=UPI0030CBEA44